MMRLTSTHFGVFVIFAAIYAAGTLALGTLPIGDIRVKTGEIVTPLAAIFGFASVVGLVFGQFIANMASPLGPLDLITPGVAFIALLVLRKLANKSIFLGVVAYYFITSFWIAFLTSTVTGRGDAFANAFIGQGIALAIGTALYFAVKSRMPKPVKPQAIEP
ncbi:MAG: QueT transporter family protein [Candidatus Caldarchaeum sp.]|nr:QueT transporter family protein [Candidatus Caldarchaeum sp.]MCX8200922.1 QueT transporter family protein [Candidatus Caldarchaeum sp.]MDW8360730.1 QueT transporter family protein [Candidatus Caldarchaeum sp.]MDW8434750.1 QueT transporter family protein [Candidatus Caldarchaeum sp.]